MSRKNIPSEKEELEKLITNYEAAKAENRQLYLDGDQLADISDWYASRSKFEEAQEAVTYGLQLHPGNTDLLVEQAYLYLDTRNLQKAKQVLDSITEAYDPEVKMLKAELLLNEGQLEETRSLLATIEDADELGSICEVVYLYLEMGYPDFASQVNILRDRQTGDPLEAVATVSSCAEVLAMQKEAQSVHMADALLEYVTSLAEASRSHPLTVLGVSPRGALAVCRISRSRAYMAGRDYVLPDDVAAVFADVCAHRLILSPKARIAETTAKDVLAEVVQQVPRPDHI